MKYGYVIEWFEGCWFAQGEGDPCRTLVIENAQVFKAVSAAKARITIDSKRLNYRDFSKAKIKLVQTLNEKVEAVCN